MNSEEFFVGLDSLFAQKDLGGAEVYLINHLDTACSCGDAAYQLTVLNEQVGYYRSLGKFTQSLSAAELAMSIISAPEFTDSVTAATTMLNVATALRASGRISDALDMYNQVCKLYSELLDEHDPRKAALYNNMAQALMLDGNRESALQYLHQSLVILSTTARASGELATNHSNIAVLYMALGNNQAATTHLQAAMSIFESLNYDDAHYPAALAAMGQLMYLNASYNEALAHYLQALEKTESIFGQNIDYARICSNCARVYSALGMPDAAAELLQTAQAVEAKLKTAHSKERS